MRIAIVTGFLFLSSIISAQKPDRISLDTAAISALTKKINDQVYNYDDSINKKMIQEQTQRSVDFFVQMQQEKKAKQKKQAIIRLIIGAGFLVILVVGLLRRRKLGKKG